MFADSNVNDTGADCCHRFYSSNRYVSGSFFNVGGVVNGKPYWIDESTTYAFWYDGHSGADFDWMR